MPDDQDAPALEHLRGKREGTLIADEVPSRIKVVADGASGRLVFPAPGTALAAEHLTLFLPEEDPEDGEELQLMLSIEELDAAHEATDRWRAYHGEPRLSRWAGCTIEGARFRGRVVEHEAMNAGNPLRSAEPRLCK